MKPLPFIREERKAKPQGSLTRHRLLDRIGLTAISIEKRFGEPYTRLQGMGIELAMRSQPFRHAGIGTSGRAFTMAPPDTPMASDEWVYSLRQTIPCIRYEWMRLRKSSPTATVGSFYQHSRTYPTIPRQPEQQAALTGYRAELPQSEADIRAFDAAVRQLIEPTVQLLMDDIQGVKATKP